MWPHSIITSIACNVNTELIAIGAPPTGAASSWKKPVAKQPMDICRTLLHSAIVRTSATGHIVSLASAGATGALASGIAHYLVPRGSDLLLIPEYHELKDFIGTAFTGVLGAGMAFVRMMENGYFWHAHYEESLAVMLSPKVAQPDFVFVKGGSVAIVESKGTGANLANALSSAQNGYVRQVYPAFMRSLAAGGCPTEGYAFGTSLGTAATPHMPLEMASAFGFHPSASTASVAPPTMSSNVTSLQIKAIKRLNYLKAVRQMGLVRRMQADVGLDPQTDSPDNSPAETSPWENMLDVDRLAAGKHDTQLFFGPPLAIFELNSQIYTAKVAMSFGLLRRLKEQDYPEDEIDNGISTLLVDGNSKGYLFVNFPDQVKVVYSPLIRGDETPI